MASWHRQRMPTRQERVRIPALLLIVLIGFVVRVTLMRNDPLHVDELFEARDLIPQSLTEDIAQFRLDAQLLHVLLTRPLSWLGMEIFLLRWSSLIIGLLAIPLAYQLGRRMFSGFVGMLAAAVFAVLPVAVSTSIEIRGYSLVISLSLGAGLCLLQSLETLRLRDWLLLSTLLSLLIWNHAFGILLVAVVVLYLAWRSLCEWSSLQAEDRLARLRGLFVILLATGATGLAILALVLQSGRSDTHHLLFSDNWASDIVPLQISDPLPTLISYLQPLRRANFGDWHSWHLGLYGLLVMIGLAVGLGHRKYRHNAVYLLMLALVPILLTTAAQAVIEFHAFTRFLDFTLPAYVLLAGQGIWSLGRALGRVSTAAGWGAGLLLTGLWMHPSWDAYVERYALGNSQQLVQTAHYLRQHANPDDLFLCVARDEPQPDNERLGDVERVKSEKCLLTLYFYPDLADRAFAWQEITFPVWQNLITPGQRCGSVFRDHPHPAMDISCDRGEPYGPYVWLVFWQPLPGQAPFDDVRYRAEAEFGSTRLIRLAGSQRLVDNFREAAALILADDRVSNIRTLRNVLAAAHLYATLGETALAEQLLADNRYRLETLDQEEQRSLIRQAELLVSYLPYLGGEAWPDVASESVWGDQVELRGHKVVATPGPNDTLEIEVTLFWGAAPFGQASQPKFTAFLHWRDDTGRILQQVDFVPYDGRLPTTLWKMGGLVRETRTLHVPATNTPHHLVLGVYDTQSGSRLPLNGDYSGESVLELLTWP